jgi:class 3 adenylate cyclase
LQWACPVCGADVAADARFCSSCGTPIASVRAGSSPEERPGERPEERKVVTIVFADVTGSTTLGERLDPEHLSEVMQTYFAAMREEIEAQGGTVEKFIGDAVMAAFGVPSAHEDDPARALRAGLRMLERLAGVNEDLARSHDVALQIRIGVNTGEVLATIAPRPGEAMVTGDAVNAAARLQAAAAPGELYASERTVRSARGFVFDDVGPLALRGKSDRVHAFRVTGMMEVAGERGVPGLSAPIVGRDAELELLWSVYERVRSEGKPNLVTIYGDAGVGKSRLTREFVDRVEAVDPAPTVLRGRCLPYGEGVTFWPLAEILKAQAGVLDSDPQPLALEKIRKTGRELFREGSPSDAARATAALAYTVGVEDPDQPFSSTEPRQVRREVHAAWRWFFSALSSSRPVITVVEDIHWADAALLDLLDELADRVVGPVLFVCPSRPDLIATRPSWGGGRRNHSAVALDPLTPDESRDLVGSLLAIDDLPDQVRERILARAEGNPFFLEEIVRQLIDEGLIAREGGRWRAAGGIERVRIPDTVQAVLAARVDLLGADDKRVLHAAAVVGRVFWPGPIERLTALGRDSIDTALRRLEDRELVVSRLSSSIAEEAEYIFKHVLTRDVAYEGLPKRERSAAHAGIASWIEDTAHGRRSEFVELLANHLEAALRERSASATSDGGGQLLDRAVDALIEASEDARRRFATDKARSLAERALALAVSPLDRGRCLTQVGMVALTDYRGDTAWVSLKEATDLLLEHAPEDGLSIAGWSARAVETPTRWPGSMQMQVSEEEVARYIEIGLANAPEGDSEERTRLLIARAFQPFAAGTQRMLGDEELEVAERDGLEAFEMASRIGRPDLGSAALDAAGSVPANHGDYRRMKQIITQRLALVDRLDDPMELGDIYSMNCWCDAYIGDLRGARENATKGVEAAADAPTVVACLSWLGYAEFSLGNWDRVVDEIQPQIEQRLRDRADRPPYFTAPTYGATAFVLAVREDPSADRYVDIVASAVGEVQGYSVGMLEGWLARILAFRGRTDEALSMLGSVSEGARRGIARPFIEQATCEVLADAAAWDAVPTFLMSARSYAASVGLVALPAHLDRLEGRALLAAGEPDRASERLEAASTAFSEIGARWERAGTDVDLAKARENGDPSRSTALLRAAETVFRDLGAVRQLEDVRLALGAG